MDIELEEVLKRAGNWPQATQRELVAIALELEAVVDLRPYAASADELEAIDDADASGIAAKDEVESAFAALRRG